MIIGIYVIFQIIAIISFGISFVTKNEVIWGITSVLFGILMISSFNVEMPTYQFNETIRTFEPIVLSYSYPYLMGINMLFFSLALVFGIWDVYSKIMETNQK